MRNIFGACAASVATFFLASAASAATIGSAELQACDGLAACSPTGATLSASGGDGFLRGKFVDGQFGLGVGGSTGGEIDFDEAISAVFDVDSILTAFRIVFFYNGPEFGDDNEVGTLTVTFAGGAVDVFSINVTGENVATISSGLGSVVNCGATTIGGSGCFDFLGAFGDALISSIVFTAPNLPSAGGNNSDYALGGFELSEIPVPGALLLLLTGIGGLTFASRSRKRLVVQS